MMYFAINFNGLDNVISGGRINDFILFEVLFDDIEWMTFQTGQSCWNFFMLSKRFTKENVCDQQLATISQLSRSYLGLVFKFELISTIQFFIEQ